MEDLEPQGRQVDTLAKGGVHIRVQQRNSRKSVTTVSGLAALWPNRKLNFERINREFQKRWGCSGTVIHDDKYGMVIQLQGNMSDNVRQFLIDERLATADKMEVHSL